MVEALKPKLKFDTAGIGHDAKEFKWWESVYEKASKNVEIIPKEKGQSEMRVKAKEADALRISTSQYTMENGERKNDLRYGNFLKTCTLNNGQTTPEENAPEGKKETRRIGEELSDEQLFAACGGRTAHKGARHGLKLSGKLARIARQEALLLGASREVQTSNEPTDAAQEWEQLKNKKNKKRKREKSTNTEMIDLESLETLDGKDSNKNILSDAAETLRASKKSKKSKKKEKRRLEELASKLDAFTIDDQRENQTDQSLITINLEEEEQQVEKIVKSSDNERANLRIERKKKKSWLKKENKRLENLSNSLMAFNLSENSVQSERLSEELRAKLKKKRKKKREIGKLKKSKSQIPGVQTVVS